LHPPGSRSLTRPAGCSGGSALARQEVLAGWARVAARDGSGSNFLRSGEARLRRHVTSAQHACRSLSRRSHPWPVGDARLRARTSDPVVAEPGRLARRRPPSRRAGLAARLPSPCPAHAFVRFTRNSSVPWSWTDTKPPMFGALIP